MLPALMHQGKFYLGHLLQVPVYVEIWIVVLIFFGWSQYADAGAASALIGITALLLTVVCHEFGHALVARALNMRGVAITISGLGGYCSYSGEPSPGRKIAITAAGPGTNFLLAGAAYACLHYHLFSVPEVIFFCIQFWWWNLVLGCLNSFPIYPLDGGQIALAAAQSSFHRQGTAQRFTLVLSVIAAFALVALDGWLRGGQPSRVTMGMAVYLLFTAFATLR
jgi:membrane-associated protease RseP (regulator of RpoE activity)